MRVKVGMGCVGGGNRTGVRVKVGRGGWGGCYGGGVMEGVLWMMMI